MLGICGSVAAYKAADLASKLTQAGARVDVILTHAAERFISPLSLESLTGRKAYTDADLWGSDAHILHVGLAQSADLFLIAPCTANTLAKLAHGKADNLLSITALATQAPLLLAPAMDAGMFLHPATQANVKTLQTRGVCFAGPVEGRMASGLFGLGRMIERDEIMGHARRILGRNGSLAGKKIVVTAGGTREAIDPVRFITNRSSGKQGYALAQAALDEGAEVALISAPTALKAPVGAALLPVCSAEEMLNAVLEETANADVLLMAAAVADFRPKQTAQKKLKKREGIPQIKLEAAPDILGRLASPNSGASRPRVTVGFAAESRDLLKNASEKLHEKKLDFIAANNISANDAGFDVDQNRVTLLFPDGRQEKLPLQSKTDVAKIIIARVSALLAEKTKQ